MWQTIASGWLKGTLANITRIEEEQARKAAPAVAPIEFTPIS